MTDIFRYYIRGFRGDLVVLYTFESNAGRQLSVLSFFLGWEEVADKLDNTSPLGDRYFVF